MDVNKAMSNKFIEELAGSEEKAMVYLMNGIKLTGKILEFDDVAIRMTAENSHSQRGQLVYKSAISTIKPVD